MRGRAAPVSLPQSPAASVGEQVITRYAKPLKVANKVVDDGTAFRVYQVGQVKGDWLWLESGRVRGWVEAGNVVPYSQAVDHFTRQIAVAHKAASAYTCRGIVRHAKGEYDDAIADYSEALRLDPKLALAYYNRGLAWQKKQDLDRAIADYNEAIRVAPRYALAYRMRGTAQHAKQDFDQAIADYDAALRLDPKHALAYHNRGLAWRAKRDFDQAIADCTRACELAGWSDWRFIHTLAAACAAAGDFDAAVKHGELALSMAPAEHKQRSVTAIEAYKARRPHREQAVD